MQALIGLASVLMEDGRTDDVITLCKRTLSLDERNAQAHTLLGEVYAAQMKPGEAAALREGSRDPAEADPESPQPGR